MIESYPNTRVFRGIRVAAAICWLLILLVWSATGFLGGLPELGNAVLELSREGGRLIGIFVGIVIAVTLFGTALEAGVFALIFAGMALKSGVSSLRRSPETRTKAKH